MDIINLSKDYKPIIELFGALLSPVIAATVAYIAYQQWRTSQRKELRESHQAKLLVYLRVKKLLRSIDSAREVRLDHYHDFTEALAEADFLFPKKIQEWLSEVDISAHCWLDARERISLWKKEGNDPNADWIIKEEKQMDQEIDGLQDAHCELLKLFQPYMQMHK